MIQARSPYIVHFDDANLEDIEYKLYIYGGTKTTDEVLRHTFAIDAVNGEVTFDIAPYIRDYVKDFTITNDSRTVWVHGEVAKDTGSGLGAYSSHLAEELAVYGYNLPEDGVNFDHYADAYTGNEVYFAQKIFYANTASPYYLYGYIFKPEGETGIVTVAKQTEFAGPNTYSLEFFTSADAYISEVDINRTSVEADETTEQFDRATIPANCHYMKVMASIAGEQTRLYVRNLPKCENGYERIDFINRIGQRQSIYMVGKSIENYRVSSDSYKKNIVSGGTYSQYDHQKYKLNTTATKVMVVSTGWYPEEYNEVFKELMLSETVWILDGAFNRPVNILNSDFKFKTKRYDKLINYEFTFEVAQSEINDIR